MVTTDTGSTRARSESSKLPSTCDRLTTREQLSCSMQLSVLDAAHIPQVRAKNESTVSVGLLVAHLSFPNPLCVKYSAHSMRRYGSIKLSLVEYPIQSEDTNVKTVVKTDFTTADVFL